MKGECLEKENQEQAEDLHSILLDRYCFGSMHLPLLLADLYCIQDKTGHVRSTASLDLQTYPE